MILPCPENEDCSAASPEQPALGQPARTPLRDVLLFERINLRKRKGINEPNASVREQLAKVAVTYPCIGIRLIDHCPAQCWAISI
jgi:hypothetical protein